MTSETPDNLGAAMDAVMRSESLTRKTNTNSKPGNPATKQFLMRMTPDEHESWRAFSELLGVSMAEMVRDAVRDYIAKNQKDPQVCQRTDCSLVAYPWGVTTCQTCSRTWR